MDKRSSYLYRLRRCRRFGVSNRSFSASLGRIATNVRSVFDYNRLNIDREISKRETNTIDWSIIVNNTIAFYRQLRIPRRRHVPRAPRTRRLNRSRPDGLTATPSPYPGPSRNHVYAGHERSTATAAAT